MNIFIILLLVYLLWREPDLIPHFIVHKGVMQFISKGKKKKKIENENENKIQKEIKKKEVIILFIFIT